MKCCDDEMVTVTDCEGKLVRVCVWCEKVEEERIAVLPPRYVNSRDIWK
jgi:hypothetical protein